ncbi:hypothetical protein ACFQE2_01825 [Methylophaga thalassica]|uniref:hypothetical protein n=1 Tax=Methylophaga thalassica TaxID=40223 RepID=UPI00360922BE
MDAKAAAERPIQQDEKTALQAEIINMLFGSNLKSFIVASLVAITLAYVEYDQVNNIILFSWCVIFCFVYGLRFYTTLYFQRHSADYPTDYWLNIFRLSTLACGMAWGFAGYYFLSETNEVAHKAFITLVIVGVTGGQWWYML